MSDLMSKNNFKKFAVGPRKEGGSIYLIFIFFCVKKLQKFKNQLHFQTYSKIVKRMFESRVTLPLSIYLPIKRQK